jgi:hypothetical protein
MAFLARCAELSLLLSTPCCSTFSVMEARPASLRRMNEHIAYVGSCSTAASHSLPFKRLLEHRQWQLCDRHICQDQSCCAKFVVGSSDSCANLCFIHLQLALLFLPPVRLETVWRMRDTCCISDYKMSPRKMLLFLSKFNWLITA